MKVLLATRNSGKLRELQGILGDVGLELVSLEAYPQIAEPEETGRTFLENARIKAIYYHELTNMPALSDDSGLVVEALDGAPGLLSARYAATDVERVQRLLGELSALPNAGRQARFICALCLCLGPGRLVETEASVAGTILEAPRGKGGFGYDPIFYYPPLGRTFAELTAEEKNQVSHRSRALRQLRSKLLEQAAARNNPEAG